MTRKNGENETFVALQRHGTLLHATFSRNFSRSDSKIIGQIFDDYHDGFLFDEFGIINGVETLLRLLISIESILTLRVKCQNDLSIVNVNLIMVFVRKDFDDVVVAVTIVIINLIEVDVCFSRETA